MSEDEKQENDSQLEGVQKTLFDLTLQHEILTKKLMDQSFVLVQIQLTATKALEMLKRGEAGRKGRSVRDLIFFTVATITIIGLCTANLMYMERMK
jgi:hypothetical protein